MINTAVLKIRARELIKGIYPSCVLGAFICMIPYYLISMLNGVFAASDAAMGFTAIILPQILQIVVVDVFTVGYFRSLLNARKSGDEKRYDVNDVLSGYRMDFKNTIKVLGMRYLYKLGWSLLISLPLAVGVSLYFVTTPAEAINELYNLLMGLLESFSEQMLMNVYNHIFSSNAYVEYIMIGSCVVSLILFIPYVRKMYEYMMIPMVLAENPSQTVKEAFGSARNVIDGYRMKYFILQLSFIGVALIASIAVGIIPSTIFACVLAATVLPYIFAAFLEFYLVRTEHLCYNEDMLNERVDTNEN